MSPEVKKYLHDAYIATGRIQEYLQGVAAFEDFVANVMRLQAIERNFEIIGEALNYAHGLQGVLPITGFKEIIALRHRIIHGYREVNYRTLWLICQEKLPILHAELQAIVG